MVVTLVFIYTSSFHIILTLLSNCYKDFRGYFVAVFIKKISLSKSDYSQAIILDTDSNMNAALHGMRFLGFENE
jgi:hypothetical protein